MHCLALTPPHPQYPDSNVRPCALFDFLIGSWVASTYALHRDLDNQSVYRTSINGTYKWPRHVAAPRTTGTLFLPGG
jgi:hypothetical protein